MPATTTLNLYTFRLGARVNVVRARTPNAAAERYARNKGLPETAWSVYGLFAYLAQTGWIAEMTDERGDVVATIDPETRQQTFFPPMD